MHGSGARGPAMGISASCCKPCHNAESLEPKVVETDDRQSDVEEIADVQAALPDGNAGEELKEPKDTELQAESKEEEPPNEELEASLAEVKRLCYVSRLFDALAALKDIEEQASKSTGACFSARLGRDETVARLRKRQTSWLKEIVPLINACTRKDVAWNTVEEGEPKAGARARVRVSVRNLIDGERDPAGTATQGATLQQMMNIPAGFLDTVTKMVEADLFDKSELDSCVAFQGFVGGPHRFHRSYKQVQFAPAPFLKVFDNILMDVFVCPTPPPGLEQFGPGVLCYDRSLPLTDVDGQGYYDGFKVLDKPSWYMQIKNAALFYWTPSSEVPNCSNLVILSQIALPVPEWMLPVKLGTSILVKLARGSLIKAAANSKCPEKLAQLARRREQTPELYVAIKELGSRPAAEGGALREV